MSQFSLTTPSSSSLPRPSVPMSPFSLSQRQVLHPYLVPLFLHPRSLAQHQVIHSYLVPLFLHTPFFHTTPSSSPPYLVPLFLHPRSLAQRQVLHSYLVPLFLHPRCLRQVLHPPSRPSVPTSPFSHTALSSSPSYNSSFCSHISACSHTTPSSSPLSVHSVPFSPILSSFSSHISLLSLTQQQVHYSYLALLLSNVTQGQVLYSILFNLSSISSFPNASIYPCPFLHICTNHLLR
jgi:hypothetical protein